MEQLTVVLKSLYDVGVVVPCTWASESNIEKTTALRVGAMIFEISDFVKKFKALFLDSK